MKYAENDCAVTCSKRTLPMFVNVTVTRRNHNQAACLPLSSSTCQRLYGVVSYVNGTLTVDHYNQDYNSTRIHPGPLLESGGVSNPTSHQSTCLRIQFHGQFGEISLGFRAHERGCF